MKVVRLSHLGQALRRTPWRPGSVAALLDGRCPAVAFRCLVHEIVPQHAVHILHPSPEPREGDRVAAFLRLIEEQFFPVYELETYEEVLAGIPFLRNAWSYDDLHELERPVGERLLLALCTQPFAPGFDSRLPLLSTVEEVVPQEVLAKLPEAGFLPEVLHARFDGTSCVAAAEFADWLWGQTGSVFLDLDDETVVPDAGWSRETLLELAAQWQRAREILEHIAELETWLEADPARHFAELLDAAMGCEDRLVYEKTRRLYVIEITPEGIVPIAPDAPEASALSPGPAR